jgi:Spy/CpxP family protein refolding chaperone
MMVRNLEQEEFFMTNRSLLVVSLVALMSMGVMVAASNAQTTPSASPASPAVTATGPQPSEPSGEFMGRGHHGHFMEAMMKKLGITDDQKKQIRGLYVGFKDRTRKARADLMSLKDEKKTMLLSGKIDQQKLAQIDEQVVKLKSDVMREKLKLRRDRLALLKPEQIDRIADWQAEKAFRHKWKKMHAGRMHGDGPGHSED